MSTAAEAAEPEGFAYRPDLLTPEEEVELLTFLEGLEFEDVTLHGRTARRRVRHYGVRYRYQERAVEPADPVPPPLAAVRERAARLVGLEAEELRETLVTRYPPGATIGWHRDAPMFGPVVIGVSLGAACRLRFQRRRDERRETHELVVEPRSAYVLAGAARASWQHSIPPVKELRHSITFRTLRSR